MKMFAIFVLVVLRVTLSVANDSVLTVKESIMSALKCEPNGEQTINEVIVALKKSGLDFAKAGMKIKVIDEDMDERIVITFDKSINLFGTKTNQVIHEYNALWSFSSDFTGDPDTVIKMLGLRLEYPLNGTPPNVLYQEDYVSGLPRNAEKKCVPLKRLRKLGKNKFRFGCGWCFE